MTAPICYCGKVSVFLPSSEHLYGTEFGPVYFCEDCFAWVGCHKNTNKPLGIPATKKIRDARKLAHAAFDPLWISLWKELNKAHSEHLKRDVPEFYGKGPARKALYAWLAEHMDIPVEECHISWFDVDDCKRVIDICRSKS